MTGWVLGVFIMINGQPVMTSLAPMKDRATCEQMAEVVRRSTSGQIAQAPRAQCHYYGPDDKPKGK